MTTESTGHAKLFNRYSIIARVYPALLCVFPIVWTVVVLLPKLVSDYHALFGSAVLVSAFWYLLATVARSQGKRAEIRLLKMWGAWPTTIMLRHRDHTVDPITKARYHKALTALNGIGNLPTAAEEAKDPGHADNIYRSATKRLIEHRRGSKYQMVEDENASYGFRRNFYGLRRAAVIIASAVALVTLIVWWVSAAKPLDMAHVEASIATYPYLLVLIFADVTYLALISIIINQEFVRQAADEYASALLRTLESHIAVE